jgi:hypothetical protein
LIVVPLMVPVTAPVDRQGVPLTVIVPVKLLPAWVHVKENVPLEVSGEVSCQVPLHWPPRPSPEGAVEAAVDGAGVGVGVATGGAGVGVAASTDWGARVAGGAAVDAEELHAAITRVKPTMKAKSRNAAGFIWTARACCFGFLSCCAVGGREEGVA